MHGKVPKIVAEALGDLGASVRQIRYSGWGPRIAEAALASEHPHASTAKAGFGTGHRLLFHATAHLLLAGMGLFVAGITAFTAAAALRATLPASNPAVARACLGVPDHLRLARHEQLHVVGAGDAHLDAHLVRVQVEGPDGLAVLLAGHPAQREREMLLQVVPHLVALLGDLDRPRRQRARAAVVGVGAAEKLDAVVKPEPTIDALNINTYAGPPPRTSGRRRKPSVLVHQVSVDEDDGGLYVQPAPRPVYQGGVRLSALRVKQLVDSDQATLDRDEICEAMDVDGKVSQTDYGRCGGMLSGRLGPNKFIVDYAKGLRSKCKRHRCKHAFRDGELRVGKIPPRARKDVPARRVHWYHPACIFKSFERASKKTKTIDTIDEIEGFEELHKSDQRDLAKRVDDWAARKAEEAPEEEDDDDFLKTIKYRPLAPE